ncbi:hypothetical protein FOE78_06005 [Microlunatus elymi]|uniref:Uncharacterized protein n=1 Tax=Microlunatus elymi TaxID=2596828 RepID=A0A516PWG1_9ACTN|nr:hypothetical protein [Microlunatus elymi]QDP95517.1 hypothetical protein FOE78_06005 [Microlunatus elymi]
MSAVVLAGGLLFGTVGCSPTIQSGGREIADPGQPLQAALSKLKKDNYASIQNNSVTVGDNTNCFYQRPNKDSDDITDQVACGPIRRIGQPDDHVWDTYRLSFQPSADGKSTARVQSATAHAVVVNTALLVSPDDTKPGAAADVPAPQVPQTSITDRAVALSDQDLSDVTFSTPAQPIKLITPTATVQVIGQAVPGRVPQQLVAGQDDPAGNAPYYRPATGQKVYAYKVKISAPAEHAVPASTTAAGTVPDLTTQLSIGVGDQQLPIADNRADPQKSFKINCGTTGAAYPCKPAADTFVILMTVPDNAAPSLAATTAKHTQSIALGTGQLTSSVSQVEYGHNSLVAKIGEKVKVPSYQAKISVPDPTAKPPADDQSADDQSAGDQSAGDQSKGGSSKDEPSADSSAGASDKQTEPATKTKTKKASWSMRIDSVALSAFDPTRGWAPAGKAWLVVTTSGYAKHDPDDAFTDKRVSSIAVTSAGATYRPDGLTDADFAGGGPLATSSEVSWVFSVPDDLTEADFTFRPTGTVAADGTSTAFTVPKPATATLKPPK